MNLQSLNPKQLIKVFLRLIAGYVLAIVFGAIFLAFILTACGVNQAPWSEIPFLTLIAAYFGALFGLPYTIIGSLAVYFLFPRNRIAFLLIGMFCPASALLLLNSFIQENMDRSLYLYSLPPGLLAAYIYGAIGFGYGFGRWKRTEPA